MFQHRTCLTAVFECAPPFAGVNVQRPAGLRQALQFLQSGPPEKCVSVCNEILAEHPESVQARYLRGCARYQTGELSRSILDLERVHRDHPQHLHAAYYLGRSLRAAGREEEALAPLKAAVAEQELEVLARYELATCLARLRRRNDAMDQYRAILRVDPGNAQVAANLASLLERQNRLEEATSWAARALAMHPSNETAQMTQATLDRRRGRYAEAESRLRGLIASVDHAVNRSLAWNQLGQCLEGQEQWGEAFSAYSESNRILQAHHPAARAVPRGPHSLHTLARIHAWLQDNPMAAWKAPAVPDRGGIAFLVGFPRSGTTLLDRMLSSHPGVEVLEEKGLFSRLHQDWSQTGTLEALAGVSESQIADARARYRQEMSRHRRRPRRPLVIDKLPLNLAYLFLIHRLFPRAPVIFLLRHPLDVCISCFFQAFELQASMAYFLDLEQTARYYDAVMRVASLSMEQIGSQVHTLRYEDLVRAPEDPLRGLLRFLAVEWNDSVLDHRQGGAEPGDTPSYQQVSQPLYTRSIERWRHYAGPLEPCFGVLEPWVKRFAYAT